MSNAKNALQMVALSVSLCFSLGAFAAQAASDATAVETLNDQGIVKELGRVQTLSVLAKARLNLKEAQDQLTPEQSRTGAGSGMPIVQAAGNTLPNVRLIINDTAYFVFSDGSHGTGKVGSTLPGGWKVSAMSFADRTVVVKDKGGREYHLSMSNNAPAAPVDPQQSSMRPVGLLSSPSVIPSQMMAPQALQRPVR